MKAFEQKYGPWALITGASSGFGAEFARQLGARKLNLLLVARRLSQMQQLAEQLIHDYGIQVRSVRCDLSSANFMTDLKPHIEELDIGLLVNNAGFVNTGAVINNNLERELELLYVNCRAYLMLAHELGNRLKSRGHGGMIFVSSTTAYAPPTLWANYAASKAYELALGEAMHEELRGEGVDVLVVCPGPARTDFYAASDLDLSKTSGKASFLVMEASEIVSVALKSLGKKRSVVPGWGNKLIIQMGRILPKSFSMKNVSDFVASVR